MERQYKNNLKGLGPASRRTGVRKRHLCTLLFAALLIFTASAGADIKQDRHIQASSDAVQLDIDPRTFTAIKGFLAEGYAPASIMLHGISLGMPIDDLVYLAVKSNPQRAQEFYDTALALLPFLPGWTCRQTTGAGEHVQGYEVADLGANRAIAEVARRYFEENKQLIPFPNWAGGDGHMDASAGELASLISDQWWYQQGRTAPRSSLSAPNRPIFVSLYKDNKEIIIDADLERVRSGPALFPVVFIYNEENVRPIGRYESDVTVSQIAQDYFSSGIQVTGIPEWHVGDHHTIAEIAELKELVKLPKKKDLAPEHWQAIESDLKEKGFTTPLLLTLFASGDGQIWVDQLQEIAVADAMGIQQAPVVFLYHSLERSPCGQEATCTDGICKAAVAGGADPAICRQEGGQKQQGKFTPSGWLDGPQITTAEARWATAMNYDATANNCYTPNNKYK